MISTTSLSGACGLMLLSIAGCGSDGGTSNQSASGTGGTAGGGSGGVAGASTGGVGGAAGAGGSVPTSLPILGDGSHSSNQLEIAVIGTADNLLIDPRDLAFNPDVPGELWVACSRDPSMVIFHNTGESGQISERHSGSGSNHFMAQVAGLAFGQTGRLATAHEEDEITQSSTPAMFMGPSLWTSDLSIFNAGTTGHMDMLHNSPNSAGIAWEQENAYWVFDGFHGSLSRYDFHTDHGPGGTNHRDGELARYVEGQVAYVEGVPSHLEYDASSQLLYVADTGNQRIAALDTTTGTRGGSIGPNYDSSDQYEMVDATLTTLFDSSGFDLQLPSGIALRDGVLYVSDNATSTIIGIDLEGNVIDYIDLVDVIPVGGMMGITFDETGRLYMVDYVGNRVLRMSVPAT